jgi:broad specificity phosphatase PhoE
MLVLVRHGETDANAAGLVLGRADPPLSPRGRVQAAALAAALAGADRVISSPLRRARETAAAFECPIVVDDRWIELDYGALDLQAIAAVDDSMWDRWRADPDFVPPGGESLRAVGARVRDACGGLAEEVRARDVVVVSHVSPVKAAIAWALGVDETVAWRMFVELGSIARVTIGARGPLLVSFNERPGGHFTA